MVQDQRNKSAHVGLVMTTLTEVRILILCHEHEKLQEQELSQGHSKENKS
jgi:hypothetical protein